MVLCGKIIFFKQKKKKNCFSNILFFVFNLALDEDMEGKSCSFFGTGFWVNYGCTI